MGWNITYSDGTEDVVECFKDKAKEAGVSIPHFLSKWEDLDENLTGTYDAVLCRGNSFISIATFEDREPKPFAESLAKMKKAMQAFYNKTNAGGVLYIDIPTRETGMPETDLVITQTDQTFQAKNTINYDPETRTRKSVNQGGSLINGKNIVLRIINTP